MMRFANPEFLWLIPLSAFVVWWWVRRQRPALRFSDTSLFAGEQGRRSRSAQWGGALLRGLTCLALIVACAGPRLPDQRTRIPAEAIAIMMIVDISNSMEAQVAWSRNEPLVSRLEAARRAFQYFVAGGEAPTGAKFEARPSNQIGLIALAAVPQVVCPLTLNHSVLLRVAEKLEPRAPGVDAGTNIGDAIALGVIRLERIASVKEKILILLSDGEHIQTKEGAEATLRPREAAQLAANLGYKIYTIDSGGDVPSTAAPETQAERAQGRETLRVIADMTGGRAFTAMNGADMLTAFKEIDQLERVPVQSFQYRRYFEYYSWFAAVAVVSLLAAHVLERTRWRVWP